MKTTIVLALAFVILAAEIFAVVFFLLNPDLSPAGRAAIDGYVQFERATLGRDLTVARMSHATKPWLFTAAASAATFGDSLYYITSRSYVVETEPPRGSDALGWPLYEPATATSQTAAVVLTPESFGSRSRGGTRPLPYPPTEVWCVALHGADSGPRVVFAALHADLYNAGWVIHEPRAKPGSVELEALLSEIGCDLRVGD